MVQCFGWYEAHLVTTCASEGLSRFVVEAGNTVNHSADAWFSDERWATSGV